MPKFHTCRTCRKYEKCRSICDKARAYADRDHVKLRELTIGVPIATEKIQEIEPPRGPILTKKELRIFTLSSINGFSREEIAKALRISRGSLRVHLAGIRKKLSEWKDAEADENSQDCQHFQAKEE
jgi:DNA-binding CsgD family transcriptional regulator